MYACGEDHGFDMHPSACWCNIFGFYDPLSYRFAVTKFYEGGKVIFPRNRINRISLEDVI